MAIDTTHYTNCCVNSWCLSPDLNDTSHMTGQARHNKAWGIQSQPGLAEHSLSTASHSYNL